MKKLFIVRKEVYATSIEKAIYAPGTVVYVEIAKDEFQPIEKKKVGFKKK